MKIDIEIVKMLAKKNFFFIYKRGQDPQLDTHMDVGIPLVNSNVFLKGAEMRLQGIDPDNWVDEQTVIRTHNNNLHREFGTIFILADLNDVVFKGLKMYFKTISDHSELKQKLRELKIEEVIEGGK